MITVVHDAPNEALITELFAFVSLDDTGEGICASIMPGLGSTPLVTSKARVADQMKTLAADIARRSGKPVKLVRFSRTEVMWSSAPVN